ncbi:MAG: SMP-30/gluconolactonase/LRE family protein [Alphaproteobacteria bacterium]|nr:SMP-30/gluconolactonase/LRE family protein [Alphaproteobacteria bacterium]
MKRALPVLGVVLLLVLAWLLAWPVDIDPQAWDPGPPTIGASPYDSNGRLARLSRLNIGDAHGPEDIEVDPDGTVITGVDDGRILELRRDQVKVLANTGGRPLGLDRDRKGRLWVADAVHGLLRVDKDGEVQVIVGEVDGERLRFTDDVAVAPDGKVYFTDADRVFGHARMKESLLDGGPHGRLLVWDPDTEQVSVLMDGLHFANGVAMGTGGRYLLLCETLRMRVHKVWLTGDRAGESEVVVDHLPGFPDNITSAGGGVFWVALASPRTALKDAGLRLPLLRKIGARLPTDILTRPRRHPQAVAISHLGRVLHYLDDPAGGYAPLTTVREAGGSLYLGSLEEPAVGRATAPLRLR